MKAQEPGSVKEEIIPLTTLRGIAAILVVVFHVSFNFGTNFDVATWTKFFRKGYLWVDFFFILSGFIIMYVYGNSFSLFRRKQASLISRTSETEDTWKKYKVFLRNRLARVYPLHIFTFSLFLITDILIMIILDYYELWYDDGRNPSLLILTNITLTHAWGFYEGMSFNYPSWSISTEFLAYLVFPVLSALLSKKHSYFYFVSCLVLLACLYLVSFQKQGLLSVDFKYGFCVYRCIILFSVGIILFEISGKLSKRIADYTGSDTSLLLSIVFTVILMDYGMSADVSVIPLFMWIVISARFNKGVFYKILSLKPLHFLGQISYSIYMNHAFIQTTWAMIFPKHFSKIFTKTQGITMFFLFMMLVLVCSWFTYIFIEKPARRIIKKLIV